MKSVVTGRIGVGIVGAGSFGRRLGLGVRRSADLALVGVVDADPSAAAAAAAELETSVFATLEELLAQASVAAVIVATPHASHHPIALAALSAGRHAFVEKPLTITSAEAIEVIGAAERAGLILLVGHVTRLLPLVGTALERLDAGEIGTPHAAWVTRHQPLARRGWMASAADFGMLLHSPAVHNVDLMNRILGRPQRVMAMAAPTIQAEVEYPDVAAALVGYASGAVGSLAATVSDPLFGPGGTSLTRVVGDRGGLEFDVARGTLAVQREGAAAEQVRVTAEGWGLDEAIDGELASFAAAIRGEAAPFVSPGEALAAVAVVEAAARSIDSGMPVEIEPLLAGEGP